MTIQSVLNTLKESRHPKLLFLNENEDGCLIIPNKLSIAGHTLFPRRYLKPIPADWYFFRYFPHKQH
jgi:hypothetical protein